MDHNHKGLTIAIPLFIDFIPKDIFCDAVIPYMTLLSTINLGRTCKWFHILLDRSKREQSEVIQKIQNANQVMLYVGKWGEKDLIDYMLKRGERLEKNYKMCYLAWGLASCGHHKLFKEYFDGRIDNDLMVHGAMYGAARFGDNIFVEYLLSCVGGEIDDSVWFQGLLGAIKHGDFKMIEYFMNKCSKLNTHVFTVAGETGNTKTIDYLTNHPRLSTLQNKSKCIYLGACKGGKLDLIKEYLATKSLSVKDQEDSLMMAAWGRRKNVIDYLLENKSGCRIDYGFFGAVASGDEELIEFFGNICKERPDVKTEPVIYDFVLEANPTYVRKYYSE